MNQTTVRLRVVGSSAVVTIPKPMLEALGWKCTGTSYVVLERVGPGVVKMKLDGKVHK